ncbi:alternative ribosome rescue aminoacyl-tRNA hydrolase ArfB [Coxiella burnetii]|uniref:Peptidyl-tRNA hydrolase family protein n=1 Tax=Coxiella burnetii (strain RSA 493 / Nine Mile phase I) TaxID=227377 RepID=Q83E98_COXBU|nr:alternative ribosome rescue aminoacyl-tRNA hydrolase ArfB [Coxiella burnetii]NP_819466.1 peptidyl-tRNA hydrolase family protein [Coxiella burnetii RSA 493]AAO89980.1 peptidyl-tRNA hydrolase family protein [Coxiella burnetii RSA 493]ABX79038.1 peptidyl-tRNA hydrolase domain protein [Coxiella burnetii RSA 331]AML48746.1 peptidyl-tRNA hydrolase [Coxiella burnetii]AML54716.1 peptidyl-tRNA hydrolase [Coxiella burnetii]ARI65308.1 aminoacyl-tRNA hydrolase [Coxiella burnetii]
MTLLDENEVEWRFIRASGPGGQKVNKIATAAQLRFNVPKSSLPEEIKERLVAIAGNRINTEGELVITGRRYRTQKQNRQDALERLIHFVKLAAQKPKKRKKTKPTRAAREKRLTNKHKRAETKRRRRGVDL